jgi:hypothetical protein
MGALCLPGFASANDYYSWVDGNGTMVMTDDPSRIPPADHRSQIQVHRFMEAPPSPPGPAPAEPASREREEPSDTARPEAVDPRSLDLPLVLLDEPENQVRAQYVWVPLLSPLFVGGTAVSGFWWHPGATSPVEAFKHFLAQHFRQQQNQWLPGAVVPYPFPPRMGRGPSSGHAHYDQVVREREALQESIRLRHFPNSPPPGRQVQRGAGGRPGIRSR